MPIDKKQVPLRINAKLYAALNQWAEDDFRSLNGQIEYLLTECVKQRKKNALFKFYRGKRPAITWGGVWHQCQTPPLTLLRGIIRV